MADGRRPPDQPPRGRRSPDQPPRGRRPPGGPKPRPGGGRPARPDRERRPSPTGRPKPERRPALPPKPGRERRPPPAKPRPEPPPAAAAELIWGRNAVIEALRAGRRIRRLLIAEGARQSPPIATILDLASERLIPVEITARPRLDQISLRHQGVVAEVGPFRYSTVEEILALAEQRREPPLLLVLDGVEDPQNLGSLLRTAEAVGVHGVVIPKHRAVAVTGGVEKASAGAVEYVKIAQVTNLRQVIEELKRKGIWIAGVEASGEQVYDRVDLARSLALVLGSEGKGVSRLVRDHCDFLIRLPMRGKINSLNVAVAGSIVLYEAWRQRRVTNGA